MFLANKQNQETINEEFIACTRPDHEVIAIMKQGPQYGKNNYFCGFGKNNSTDYFFNKKIA